MRRPATMLGMLFCADEVILADDLGYADNGEDNFENEGDMDDGEDDDGSVDEQLLPSKKGPAEVRKKAGKAALAGLGASLPQYPAATSVSVKSAKAINMEGKLEAFTFCFCTIACSIASFTAALNGDDDELMAALNVGGKPARPMQARPTGRMPARQHAPAPAADVLGGAEASYADDTAMPPSHAYNDDSMVPAAADGAVDAGRQEEDSEEHSARPAGISLKMKQAPSALRAAAETAASMASVPVAAAVVVSQDGPAGALSLNIGAEDFVPASAAAGPAPKQLTFERIKTKAGADADTCLFYWFDAYEDPFKAPGVLQVFGKVIVNEHDLLDALRHNARLDLQAQQQKDNTAGDDEDMDLSGTTKRPVPAPVFASACLTITGNERCMFVLPRAKNARTGEDVQYLDVYKELKETTLKTIVPPGARFGVKKVTRNYAFELDGVPREPAEYFKLVYSATLPALQPDAQGDTFSHIFGTTTTCMEHFLLKRRLLGPCWLRVTGVRNRAVSVSHCAVDLEVDSPKCVHVYGGVQDKKGQPIAPAVALRWGVSDRQVVGEVAMPVPTPDLGVLSMSIKTQLGGKGSTHEITVASLVYHPAVSQDGTSDERRSVTQSITLMQHPSGMSGFSADFRTWVGKEKNVRVLPNEKALMTILLQYIEKLDPDVLVGHNISGFDLDVILQRISTHGLNKMWSKLGRLRRDALPRTAAGVGGRAQYNGILTAGRLLCDTYLAARELVRETTYSMAGLAVAQLNLRPGERQDVEPLDVPVLLRDDAGCKLLAKHTEGDAWLAMRLMFKLQVLPLTKQLTNAAGNLWSRSLKGARAERIEYLLLHEFHRLKYIVPDKERYGDKADAKAREVEDEDDDDDDELKNKKGSKRVVATGTAARNAKGRNKPAYSGGLVLEPKKGLYDKLTLLLDFNSLYPSIIQEFNICFTTVERPLTGKVSSAIKAAKSGKGKSKAGKRKGGSEPVGPDAAEGAPAKAEDEEEEEEPDTEDVGIPAVPDSSKYPDQGVLPRVIRSLVDKRKVVKKMLAVERDPAKRQQLDIRQKAIKILANSMYGCLGFSHSRFHAKPIAALVTSQGREILSRTVNMAINNHGLDVIYGDTDSVMIYTGETDLAKVKEKGAALRADVNKLYKCLEIDIDGIFAMMLLLKKKKYASLKVQELPGGGVRLEREVKGLDMVRRDWCKLSKLLGEQLLDIILPKSGAASSEDVVENIHKLLEKKAYDIRAGQVPLEQFIITKGLNKHPQDYPDAKNQPHLQVAIAMQNSGRPVNVGDHIPFVICLEPVGTVPAINVAPSTPGAGAMPAAGSPPAVLTGAGAGGAGLMSPPPTAHDAAPAQPSTSPSDGASSRHSGVPISQRSYHPDDVRKAQGRLHIDVDWYMTQQILPPIARLCEPISGTTQARLGECLGLDPSRFRSAGGTGVALRETEEQYVAKHALPDEERFKACEQLIVKCCRCTLEQPFAGVLAAPPNMEDSSGQAIPAHFGLVCSKAGCNGLLLPKDTLVTRVPASVDFGVVQARFVNSVVMSIRRHTMLYQASWLVCEDAMCNTRTRAQSTRKAGYACPRPGCSALMRLERDPDTVHDQLQYYSALFNWERGLKRRMRLPGALLPQLPTVEELRAFMKKTPQQQAEIRSASTPLAEKLRNQDIKSVYDAVHRHVQGYLEHSGMHFVDCATLFAYVPRASQHFGITYRYLPAFKDQAAPLQGKAAAQASRRSTLPARYTITASATIAAGSAAAVKRAATGRDGLAADTNMA